MKFVLIGYGWRADIYKRVAKILPEKFELSAQVLRTKERAEEVALKDGIFTTDSLEVALETNPDYVILCVPRAITGEYLERLMKLEVPILCETPPEVDVDSLNDLWTKYTELNGKIQVVEQYFLQPYYAGMLEVIKKGYLGEVSSAMLSAIHGYHAMSMFRKLLGVRYENCVIDGKRFRADVTSTCGRQGFDTSGAVKTVTRDWASLCFESGRIALFDFTGEQYFSTIRTRRWNVQGARGEINDNIVRFLNRNNMQVEQEMKRVDVGINNISDWSHKCVMFSEDSIYENPYYPARMNDDEIAVASCMEKMGAYVETGVEFYPLREALQDTYLSFMLEKAIESGKTIITENQNWV